MAPVNGQGQSVIGVSGAGDPARVVVMRIDRCRRRLAWQAFWRRLAVVFACGAVFPLVVVVADHVWPRGLPRWLLSGAALAWVAALTALGLVAAGLSLARRLNALFAAQLFERCAGIRHNSLINTLLLRRTAEDSYAHQAAARQAAGDMAARASVKVSEPHAARTPLRVSGAVLAAWILYALVAPKAIWPSLARFFGADLAAPTATRLEWLHPTSAQTVHAGDELRFEFAVHGRQVGEVVLDVLDPNGDAPPPLARHALTRDDDRRADRWHLTLAPHEVTSDIHFRCAAGDASLTGTVPVQPRPAIAGMQIELEPPAYTGWRSETVCGPDLDVLAGTRATFRVRANVEVRDPALVLVGRRESRTRMTVDAADPSRFGLSLLLMQSSEYRIEFSDRWDYRRPDPPQHRIVVRPDAPPTVEIVIPAPEDVPDDVLDVTRYPRLVAAARDDVAVAEVVLMREQEGLQTREQVALQVSEDGRRARASVETGPLALGPGASARVWFEVRDDRVLYDKRPAPQVGKSRVLMLTRPPEAEEEQPSPEPSGDEGPAPQDDGDGRGEGDAPAGQEPAADSSRADDDPGSEPGDLAPGGAAEQGAGDDDFTAELERFVEDHGEMARDVQRRLGSQEGSGEAEEGESAEDSPADAEADEQATGAADASPGAEREDDPAAQSGGECPTPKPASGAGADPADAADRSDAQSSEGSGSPAADGDEAREPPVDSGPQERTGETPGEGRVTEAGAAASGESAADEGEADDQPLEPPPPKPENDPLPESAGYTETIDLLDMLRRGGSVTEDRLVELGWPSAKAAAFVKALERVYEAGRKSGRLDSLRRIGLDAALGDAAVRRGLGLADEVATSVESTQVRRDSLRQIAPRAEQQVPAHLRLLLDAYYRSLAEHREQAPP